MTHDYEKRVAQLEAQKPLAECYPRLPNEVPKERQRIADVLPLARQLEAGATQRENGLDAPITVAGMVLLDWRHRPGS